MFQRKKRKVLIEALEPRQLMAADLGGNQFSAAPLVTVDNDITLSDWVGRSDSVDIFRFRLTREATVDLIMSNLANDIDLQLFDSGQRLVQGSYRGGSASEAINRTLQSGDYFARVFPYGSAQSNYRLSININPVAPPDRAGNNIATARNIGALNGISAYSDFVARSGDRDDYYRLSLDTRSQIMVMLTGLSSNANLELLDSIGRRIQTSELAGTNTEIFNRALDAGTYYARVVAVSGESNYQLVFRADALATPPTAITLQARPESSSIVRLNWNDSQREDRYIVFIWNGNAWQQVVILNRDVTTFSMNGLAAGQQYYFYVRAENEAGTTNSNATSVTTLASTLSTLSSRVDWSGGSYTTDNGFRNRGYAPSQFGGWQLGSATGNCTWYAEGRLRQTSSVTGINVSRLNGLTGNAKDWDSRTSIFQATSVPQVGAIAQWEIGSYGHVAFVEQVNPDGSIVVSESSYVSNNPGSNNPADFLWRTRTIQLGATGGVFSAWPTRFLVVKA